MIIFQYNVLISYFLRINGVQFFILMEGEPSTGGEPTRDHILRGNQGFLFPEPLSVNGSSVRGGTCEPFFASALEGWLLWLYANNYSSGCELLSAELLSSPEDPASLQLSLISAPTGCPCSLLQWLMRLAWEGSTSVLDMAEHSTVIDSLYFNQLWVSVLTTIQCTKKSLGQSLRAALVCWVKGTDVEGSLILCPFSRLIGVSLSLGPVGSTTVSCLKLYILHLPPCREDLKSKQNVVGYSQDIWVTIPFYPCHSPAA